LTRKGGVVVLSGCQLVITHSLPVIAVLTINSSALADLQFENRLFSIVYFNQVSGSSFARLFIIFN
jgi:hypothetical protein